ncbi:MAG: TrmH family RNA methyltransferase [Tenacibaculum sp.]|nr:TrmH family RNA methyltransferase [Tenacibaculum sp.]
MKQLKHEEIKNNQQKFSITIVCDAIRTPENIGMCFRISESFGVQKIYLHETSPLLNNRKVERTARNTINNIEHYRYNDFKKLINKLKAEGNKIVGVEITNSSVSIHNYNFCTNEKIVLLLGSERNGIEDINLADVTISIPMYGLNSSMNVINSLAITLYEITKQITLKR